MTKKFAGFTKPSAELDVEDIEVLALIESIYQRWGYDFRDYAPASLKRRIRRYCRVGKVVIDIRFTGTSIARPLLSMQRFLDQLVVSVTSMFRDPDFT